MTAATGSSPAAGQPKELGPWLGVLGAVRPRPGPLDLDDLRIGFVTRIFTSPTTNPTKVLEYWSELVEAVARRLLDRITADIDLAAAESLCPVKWRQAWIMAPDEIRAVGNRLASSAIPLEDLAAQYAAGGGELPLNRIGNALELSWLELEEMVGIVLYESQARVAAVRNWRRPTGPLWVIAVSLLLAASLSGLMIGGYLPAPGWMEPVIAWWWSLPWP